MTCTASPIEIDENGVHWRSCTKCMTRKRLTVEFYRHAGRPSGYSAQCKDCVRAGSRRRYWAPGGDHELPRARDKRRYDTDRLVRNVESFGDVFPPACECGCGEPVRYALKGPNRFVNAAHVRWWNDYKANSRRSVDTRTAGNIPIDDFRDAIAKIRAEKGWSVREIAERGGQQRGWLTYHLFGRDVKTISRPVATAFFRRLAGLPMPPSRYQLRRGVVPKPPAPTKAMMSAD